MSWFEYILGELLKPQHDGWTYSYDSVIEYAAMTISFIVITAILGWLVGY